MKRLVSIVVLLMSALLSQAQVPAGIEYAVLPTPAEIKMSNELWLMPDTISIEFPLRIGDERQTELQLYSSVLDKVVVTTAAYEGIMIGFDPKDIQNRREESYYIKIDNEGIRILIASKKVLVYALQTLRQLYIYKEGKTYLPHCEITDYPDAPWRGILLDVCRHFIPLKNIYRTVDAMSACKMNILHLHLSDDQAFRIECKAFPLLHQKGSNGQYYTQEEIKALIRYAGDRGVQIVPEFDIPGHTTAWLCAYPEFASRTIPEKPETGYGIFKPVMNPANEKLYKHLDLFFKEMSALFPSEYIHIGGDEVRSDDWLNNPKIKKYMTKKGYTTVSQLQNYFNGRVAKILTKYNKKIIGWDEILEGQPSKGAIIHAWRGEKYQREAIAQGYGVIRSYGFYLDQTYTAGEYYARFDTLSSSLYLGGEGAMWAELVDSITLDSRLWPNAAAIAEMYWRHPKQMDSISFYKRLYKFSLLLSDMGVPHESYIHELIRRKGEMADEKKLSFLFSYVAPIDGYKRHKMIKTDSAYNSSYVLNKYADMGKPTSQAYMKFMLLLQDYKEQPTLSKKTYLEELFKDNLIKGDSLIMEINTHLVEVESEALKDHSKPLVEIQEMIELKNLAFSMQMVNMACLLWVENHTAKAKEYLNEARSNLQGRQYEISIINILEVLMK